MSADGRGLTWPAFFERLRNLDESAMFAESRLKQFLSDAVFLRQEGALILFYVDYCEIFRLLHSDLDRLLRGNWRDRLRFAVEHLALNYTFYVPTPGINLVLCSAYYYEFTHHFHRIQRELEYVRDYILQSDAELADFRDVHDVDAETRERVSKLAELLHSTKPDVELSRELSKYYLDLVLENRRKHLVDRAVAQFFRLLLEKKLHLTHDYPMVHELGEMSMDEADNEPIYKWALAALSRIAPQRQIPNKHDAWALCEIERANRRLAKQQGRLKVVLFSNSYKLKHLLYRGAAFAQTCDHGDDLDPEYMPEIRDVYYMVLRLYAENHGYEQATEEFTGLVQELGKLRKLIAELSVEQYSRRGQEVISDRVPKETIRRLYQIEQLMQEYEDINIFRYLTPDQRSEGATASPPSWEDQIENVIAAVLADNEVSSRVLNSLRHWDPSGYRHIAKAVQMLREDTDKFRSRISLALRDIRVCLVRASLDKGLGDLHERLDNHPETHTE